MGHGVVMCYLGVELKPGHSKALQWKSHLGQLRQGSQLTHPHTPRGLLSQDRQKALTPDHLWQLYFQEPKGNPE